MQARPTREGYGVRRPNIIFILIDDMGWWDLSCYGSSFYETPNLDQLAADGVCFTNAYAACPVCSPSRASIRAGQYLTDRLRDEAIRLIRENDGTPFFLNLWHYAVHIPIQVKPADLPKYQAKARAAGLDTRDPFVLGEAFPCRHKKDQRVIRRTFQSDPAYAAMVENLDANIGRLLHAVDEAGLAEDTVVIFTSDNGGLATAEGSPTCNAPLAEGKGWMYEGGTREPLILRWPGRILSGSLCDVPVTSPDFYPTILDMAGLPQRPAQHCDGESFWPLLQGAGPMRREAIFWHYPHYGNQGGTPGCSVRCGDFKLIEFFEDRRVELYNLREDCGEDHDLAAARPDVSDRLRGMLHAWLDSVEAKIPQPELMYHLAGTGSPAWPVCAIIFSFSTAEPGGRYPASPPSFFHSQ